MTVTRLEAAKYKRDHTEARHKILAKVNKTRGHNEKLGMRHIFQAVKIARYQGLVKNKTLVAAGFNPVREQGS